MQSLKFNLFIGFLFVSILGTLVHFFRSVALPFGALYLFLYPFYLSAAKAWQFRGSVDCRYLPAIEAPAHFPPQPLKHRIIFLSASQAHA